MRYYAVKPEGASDPMIRIQRAPTPRRAVEAAFGIRLIPADKGRWLVKDLGTRVSVVRSPKQRLALLTSPDGWIDPVE